MKKTFIQIIIILFGDLTGILVNGDINAVIHL